MIRLSRSQLLTIIVLVIILFLLAFVTFERLSPNGIFAGLKNDLKAIQSEEVVYTDLDGTIIDLKQFKGKPLVINSWATWVPFSKDELLLLEKVSATYKDSVTILAINRKEDTETIKAYMSIFGISGDVVFLVDPIDNFYTVVGGYATPETIFYNPDGTIHFYKHGVLTEEEVHKNIKELLNQQ